MKHFFILAFLIILFSPGNFCYGQRIVSVKLFPDNPTTEDTVYVVANVGITTQGAQLADTVVFSADTITVKSCYFQGPLQSTQSFTNTFTIGKLEEGDYVVKLIAYFTRNSNYCYDSYNDTATGKISIRKYIPPGSFEISLAPNPTLNEQEVIVITDQVKNLHISLLDMNGKLINEVFTGKTKYGETKIPIKLKDLKAGVYFYRVVWGDEVRHLKVVKL